MCWWTGCQKAKLSHAGLLGESCTEGMKNLRFRRLAEGGWAPWASVGWVLAPREGVGAGFGAASLCIWVSVVAKAHESPSQGT